MPRTQTYNVVVPNNIVFLALHFCTVLLVCFRVSEEIGCVALRQLASDH